MTHLASGFWLNTHPIVTVFPWKSMICSVNTLFITALPGLACLLGWKTAHGRCRSRWVRAQLGKAVTCGVTGQQFCYLENIENVLLRARQAMRCYTATQPGF